MSELPEFRNLINGEMCPARSGRMLDSTNPSTGEVWARIPASDASDAQAAVAAAHAAFAAWSALSATGRGYYLKMVADELGKHGDELARLETLDNGWPLHTIQPSRGMAMRFLWERAASMTQPAATGRSVLLERELMGYTLREPYGVVAVIVPWNSPVAIMASKASMALAAGNTVVVKPPEQASAAILRLAEIIAKILPPGVLNFVSGLGAEAGEPIVCDPRVRKITMTGSTVTGQRIQRAAAENMTSSVFELGGKSPNIVLADADLDAATIGVTTTSVFTINAGQGCVAGSRILVQRPILDEMLRRIRSVAEKIVIGDPFDSGTSMGPIVSQVQFDRVTGYIEIGRQEAELVFGGRSGPALVPSLPGGYWVEPTLFITGDNKKRICQEEIFGPVAVVIPFDTDDEAVAIANDSVYGLAAGVWTRDMARAHRFVRDIQAGNVWVNTYLQARHELPFSGMKASGYGHDDALEFTREKTAVIRPSGLA
ncbi:aldehyde dehydrogenase (NAD+) [Sphingomonas sp. YR710]|uniref:aldehyde dehydrogenase family protein n=1 Tax=Sphingomonas sp. YR710 TaxID=1882773 RepID=UPI00088A418F|nr:aldehyde dehydrogenase family protein [Sphingomonas sp. YR710]SDC42092.1 aldehyde dehydrogenase (NAD+) [Sphingomonas sp. YR710]